MFTTFEFHFWIYPEHVEALECVEHDETGDKSPGNDGHQAKDVPSQAQECLIWPGQKNSPWTKKETKDLLSKPCCWLFYGTWKCRLIIPQVLLQHHGQVLHPMDHQFCTWGGTIWELKIIFGMNKKFAYNLHCIQLFHTLQKGRLAH